MKQSGTLLFPIVVLFTFFFVLSREKNILRKVPTYPQRCGIVGVVAVVVAAAAVVVC